MIWKFLIIVSSPEHHHHVEQLNELSLTGDRVNFNKLPAESFETILNPVPISPAIAMYRIKAGLRECRHAETMLCHVTSNRVQNHHNRRPQDLLQVLYLMFLVLSYPYLMLSLVISFKFSA